MNVTSGLHPEGVAALIAVIVADLDIKDLPIANSDKVQALRAAIERRQRQVLEMAREYYKVYPCLFKNDSEWRTHVPRNGANNRAKLDRANLR